LPAEICTHPWRFHAEPFKIVDSLYYVGNGNVSSHLVDTGEGLILIDTAFPQTVYLLLESVRRLGFDPDDIVYLLHSHGHYDHFGGTKAIVDLAGAKTFLGEGDAEILTGRPELSWAPEYGVEFYEAFDVDTALAGGETIALGRTSIECVHTPGHTAGTISYFLRVTEGGREYTVGLHGGPGFNTLSDAYLAENGLPASRRTDFVNSLRVLSERDVDIFVGIHPNQNDTFGKQAAMTEEHNPFIDRSAWPAFLDQLKANARDQFGLT